jgi:hypothetical protein
LKATLDRYADFLFQLSVRSGVAEADGSDGDLIRRVEVGLSFVD